MKIILCGTILITMSAGAVMIDAVPVLPQSIASSTDTPHQITDKSDVSLPLAIFIVGIGGLIVTTWKASNAFVELKRDVLDLQRDHITMGDRLKNIDKEIKIIEKHIK